VERALERPPMEDPPLDATDEDDDGVTGLAVVGVTAVAVVEVSFIIFPRFMLSFQ